MAKVLITVEAFYPIKMNISNISGFYGFCHQNEIWNYPELFNYLAFHSFICLLSDVVIKFLLCMLSQARQLHTTMNLCETYHCN